ncbi:unnamed protein product, partial [Polarella glacialis]
MLSHLECPSISALRHALAEAPKEGRSLSLSLVGVSSEEECASICDALLGDGELLSNLAELTLDECAFSTSHLASLGAALRRCCGHSGETQISEATSSEDEAEFTMDPFGEQEDPDVPDASEMDVATGTSCGSSALAEANAAEDSQVVGPRSLRISRCRGPQVTQFGIPSDSWCPLWQDLPWCLCDLDLSENMLNDHAVAALCGALRQGRLRPDRLVLRGNRCKDIERLCSLICAGRLVELDLSDNLLNDKSMGQLCEVLAAPTVRLRTLILSGNKRLTKVGLSELFKKLPRSSIKSLALQGTSLCDAGVLDLISVMPSCQLDLLRLDACPQLSDAAARSLLSTAESSPGVKAIVVDEGGQRVHWRRCEDPLDLFWPGACGFQSCGSQLGHEDLAVDYAMMHVPLLDKKRLLAQRSQCSRSSAWNSPGTRSQLEAAPCARPDHGLCRSVACRRSLRLSAQLSFRRILEIVEATTE